MLLGVVLHFLQPRGGAAVFGECGEGERQKEKGFEHAGEGSGLGWLGEKKSGDQMNLIAVFLLGDL